MVQTKPTFAMMGTVISVMIFGLLLTGSEAPWQKAAPRSIALWQKQLGWRVEPPALDRRVADAAPKCLKDRLNTPSFIQQEAGRLERERGESHITGAWQGLNLANFAPTQARFLTQNEGWIASDGIDFHSCEDLPCILNKVYGGSAKEEGWQIYLYFLTSGYSLSCRDWIPAATNNNLVETLGGYRQPVNRGTFRSAPLTAHLFSKTELYSFLKLSYLLPPAYRGMNSLQRLHRVPSATYGRINGWAESTVGDYFGNRAQGFIRLAGALEEDNGSLIYDGEPRNLEKTDISGQFYKTLTHEMTHAWDAMTGGDTARNRFSYNAEWRAISGWREEIVKPTLDPNRSKMAGTPTHKWVPSPQGEGFVRKYASTNPGEDFAETAAWVRFRPDLARERSPKKTTFIAKSVFGGRTYDAAGLSRFYEESTLQNIRPRLLSMVDACVGNTQADAAKDTAAGVPEATVACMDRSLNDQINVSFDHLRATEWEACEHFEANGSTIRTRIFTQLSTEILHEMSDRAERSPVLLAVIRFRDELRSQLDPREALIHCSSHPTPEGCYQQALSDAFDHVAQPYSTVLSGVLAGEKSAFFAENPHAKILASVNQFYRQLFAEIGPQITAAVNARWQACFGTASDAPDEGMPLLRPYSGGVHYVASAILNCINAAVENDLAQVRDAYILGKGLVSLDPDVQKYTQDLLLPAYLEALQAKQDIVATAEDLHRSHRKAGVLDVLAADLLKDLSWTRGVGTDAAALSQCQPLAEAAFDRYFKRVTRSQQLPVRFMALADIRVEWSADACSRVMISPVVTRIFKDTAEKAWSDATQVLDRAISLRARDRATDCISRYPEMGRAVSRAVTSVVKSNRRLCLTAQSDWSMVESQALVDWDQTVEGHAYAARRADAQSYLAGHRRGLQNKAIAAMESR